MAQRKVSQITATKPNAIAARKNILKEENETLNDLEQNEDGRGHAAYHEPRVCYGSLMRRGRMALRTGP